MIKPDAAQNPFEQPLDAKALAFWPKFDAAAFSAQGGGDGHSVSRDDDGNKVWVANPADAPLAPTTASKSPGAPVGQELVRGAPTTRERALLSFGGTTGHLAKMAR